MLKNNLKIFSVLVGLAASFTATVSSASISRCPSGQEFVNTFFNQGQTQLALSGGLTLHSNEVLHMPAQNSGVTSSSAAIDKSTHLLTCYYSINDADTQTLYTYHITSTTEVTAVGDNWQDAGFNYIDGSDDMVCGAYSSNTDTAPTCQVST